MDRALSALDRITDKVVSYRPERKQPAAKKLKKSSGDKAEKPAPKRGNGDV